MARATHDMHVKSKLPGRVRWRVQALAERPALASSVKAALAALPGVSAVQANAMTGSVLVHFDPVLPEDHVRDVIYRAVERHVEEPAARGEPASVRGRLLGSLAVGGAAIGGVALLGLSGGVVAGAMVLAGWVIEKEFAKVLPPDVPGSDAALQEIVDPYRKSILAAVGTELAAGVFGVVRFVSLGIGINVLYHGTPLAIGALGLTVAQSVASMGVATLGAIAVRAFLKDRAQRRWGDLTTKIQRDLRNASYARVQSLEFAAFQELGRKGALRCVSDDINDLEHAFDGFWGLLDVVIGGGTMFLGVRILAPGFLWAAALPIPLLVYLSVKLFPRIRDAHQRRHAEARLLGEEIRESIDGMETVQIFNAERAEQARVARQGDAYRRASAGVVDTNSEYVRLIEVFILGSNAALYLSGVMFRGAAPIKLGTLLAVSQLITHTMFYVVRVGAIVDQIARGMAALHRVREVLALPAPADPERPAPAPRAVERDIAFKDVHFAYPGAAPIFQGVTLRFRARRITAVVGLTGSGKSSLVKLLLRFYDPARGRIEIDGVDIQRYAREDLRGMLSVVNQDVFLFSRSILENLRMGRRDASEEEIRRALRIAQAEGFVEATHAGQDSLMTDRGAGFSGGEQQRIAIARSLIKRAPILVLDEATSALDSNTEAAFWSELLPRVQEKTTIVITHRLSIARSADYIYTLEGGRVVAEGTHDELVARKGRYHELWQLQFQ